jgi:hypothetical protein
MHLGPIKLKSGFDPLKTWKIEIVDTGGRRFASFRCTNLRAYEPTHPDTFGEDSRLSYWVGKVASMILRDFMTRRVY